MDRSHEFDQTIACPKNEVVGQLRMDSKCSDFLSFLVSQLNGVGLLERIVNGEDDIV